MFHRPPWTGSAHVADNGAVRGFLLGRPLGSQLTGGFPRRSVEGACSLGPHSLTPAWRVLDLINAFAIMTLQRNLTRSV